MASPETQQLDEIRISKNTNMETTMKTILFLSILFCAIALPALGELTDADLNKIRSIIKEEIKKESAITNQKIDALDARIQNVEKDVAGMLGKHEIVGKQFENVDEQIPPAKYVLYGLIMLTVVVVAALLIFVVWKTRNDRFVKKHFETLTQEILKD